MTNQPVTLRGETLRLLPELAVYWDRRRTLLVADDKVLAVS